MGTKEILERLQLSKPNQATYKIGGKQIGPLGPINVIQSILGCCVLMGGRPIGLVFSAPEGLTRSLAEMLALSRASHHEEALDMYNRAIKQLFDAWEITRDEMKAYVATGLVFQYKSKVKIIELQIFQEIRSLEMQIRAIFCSDSNIPPDIAEAVVLSIGERAFGEIVMRPLCQIMTEFSSEHFAYLDPLQEVIAAPDQEGYIELLPDIKESVARLKQIISFRRKREGDELTFVLPGFYMAKHVGSPLIATMPFNGSDISAHMLSRALESDLVYIKHLDRPLPEGGLTALIEAQNQEPVVDGKKSELVATSVLRDLRDAGRGLYLFDPKTNKSYHLPLREKVEVQ